MELPETRYARSGDVSIAYQVVGDGPVDLVLVPPSDSHVEFFWQEPRIARFYERLASFSRLLVFDKRGTGLSDRIGDAIPNLETRMDDVRAVMDDAGSQHATLMGLSEGGPMSILFAATYPERTRGLILYGTFARALWAPDYPWGTPAERIAEHLVRLRREWGKREVLEASLRRFAPSLADDEAFRRWWVMASRMSVSPGAAVALARMNSEIDVRHVLSAIHVPTVVLHRRDDRISPLEEGRFLAERIPGARLVVLDGPDHLPFAGDVESVVSAIEDFVSSVGTTEADVEPDRVLATVLFTDIVDATARAAELGDRRWRELLSEHHALVRRQLARFRGREIDTAGDGFFASFDGPARAIRCACAVTNAVRELGLEIRAGLHTGECELIDGKVGGIAVHIGARVAGKARPGEVLVSGTVKDLVAGSGLQFGDRGVAELKGVPGEWRLYAVDSG